MYARHLYCLMTLLMDANFTNPYPRTGSEAEARELTARRIAQWAINTADFRDADAIMTPLEYDVNPLDGWQEDIDGDAATVEEGDRRIVWGCEYPELILTETLAFHDRRVKDTDHAVQTTRSAGTASRSATMTWTSSGSRKVHCSWSSTAREPGTAIIRFSHASCTRLTPIANGRGWTWGGWLPRMSVCALSRVADRGHAMARRVCVGPRHHRKHPPTQP